MCYDFTADEINEWKTKRYLQFINYILSIKLSLV